MQKEAERIAKGLYNGTINAGTIDAGMTKLVAKELRKAVMDGFGKDLPAINYSTPDYKMLSSLELNVFHFSAAENYQMLKSMSMAMRDESGLLRSFADFKKEAEKISGTYLGRHLHTEYETAVASAQMAGKWVEFEKNKAIANYLRYETAGDNKVRPEHAKINGVIKKVDDVFWSIWFPPNGFKCRCDVTQLLHGAETPSHQIELPNDVPDMFKTNMAKDGLVFPAGHPYYTDLPESLKAKAAAMRDNVYSPAYENKKTGGSVQVSNKADAIDLNYNMQQATRLADHGEQVKIRPQVMAAKNPELELINGTQKADFKQPEVATKNSYEKQIIRASKQQAQIPVMVFTPANYNKLEIVRALNNRAMWVKAKGITEVWLMFEKELVKITRADIKLGKWFGKLP